MTRMQVLWLPTRDPQAAPFALIVDQVAPTASADDAVERAEALYEFGRDIGAAGVLITNDTVDVFDAETVSVDQADPPSPEAQDAAAVIDRVLTFQGRDSLAGLVADAVRTHQETRERTPRFNPRR